MALEEIKQILVNSGLSETGALMLMAKFLEEEAELFIKCTK